MIPEGLPFEYPYRWRDLRETVGMDVDVASHFEQRDRDLEDYLAATQVPLVFHWNGQVDRFIDVRNGPGEFRSNGSIYMIRYRWDDPDAAEDATLEWELNGAPAFTHTLPAGEPVWVERPAAAYSQEAIVSIVTAVGGDALGLSAFVYFGLRV